LVVLFKILTEYSLWLVPLCLALAGGYSFFLYRKDTRFADQKPIFVRLMMLFRFIVVFFIAFLLLSPLILSITRYVEKPILLLAVDNSESIVANKDSAFYQNQFKKEIESFVAELGDKYDVKTYSFGESFTNKLDLNYTDKQTNYSNLFNELVKRYSNRNVGALIMATDGIYNQGSNPQSIINSAAYPIYSVALGDTNMQKDILVSQVEYNKIAFLGNKFPLRINVGINQLNGQSTELKVLGNGGIVFSKTINAKSNNYIEQVDVELEAKKTGVQRYKIVLSSNKNEITLKNNVKEIAVDIIDNKQKVLVLFNASHPDISAINQALSPNINLSVELSSIDKFVGKVENYNLVILHQIPSKSNSATNLLSEIIKKEIPTLFIVGSQSALTNLNNLDLGLNIKQTKQAFDESSPVLNKQFSLFEINADLKELLQGFPPLITPFGDYGVGSGDILFYQKIKTVSTSNPLILFNQNAGLKVGFITGEGIWRWRMSNYLQASNHEAFDQMMNKIVQYLALKVNKEKFIVNHKNIYNQNEPVIFDAEVYNESFELNNEADVILDIYNKNKNTYSFVFNKTDKAYRLNVGNFSVGDYTYKARVKLGEKTYFNKGSFSVLPVNVECENIIANHQLLNQLSVKSGGKMFMPNQLKELAKTIENNPNIVSVSYPEKKLEDLINLKWLFFLLLILLSAEWGFRKYLGSY